MSARYVLLLTQVTLHLNGSSDPLPFAMKVGENGEAFFVMKIDDAGEGVPEALVTSPIVGPTSEPVTPKPHELEPLDLGMSQATLDSPPSPAKDESETPGGNDVDSEEYPAPFGAGTEDVPAHELESAPPGGDTPLHASKQGALLYLRSRYGPARYGRLQSHTE